MCVSDLKDLPPEDVGFKGNLFIVCFEMTVTPCLSLTLKVIVEFSAKIARFMFAF